MILVTGGAGFIGSNLVAALERRGRPVVLCDWLGHEDKWRNISKRELHDIVAPEHLTAYLTQQKNEIKVIFHMGAISSTTETNADLIVENNFRLSCFLWRWSQEHKVPFIYASSAATYGDGHSGFSDEESPDDLARFQPLNPYGWSKHLFDRWVARQKSSNSTGLTQCVGLKFFNVYGPNEYHKGTQRSVAHQIFPFTQRNKPFPLFRSMNPQYKDGEQLRDFVWVGDCVNVMIWLSENPHVSGLFNLGSGRARSFADLAIAVYEAAGKKPLIAFQDMPSELQGKYQYFTEAPMTKLENAGYKAPFTDLQDGINIYIQNYLLQSDPYI